MGLGDQCPRGDPVGILPAIPPAGDSYATGLKIPSFFGQICVNGRHARDEHLNENVVNVLLLEKLA